MQARHLLSHVVSLSLVLAAAMTVSVPAAAQETTATVPRLITFSGTLGSVATAADESGVVMAPATAPTKVVAVTFSLYSEETGGAPLFSEVQNVHVDSAGHYTVELGASKPDGLPMDIFSSVQAHWLGVQPQGSAEQPRVLLVSVPYALKSADAETFGGRPPSAYQLAPSTETTQTTTSGTSGTASGSGNSSTGSGKPPVVTLVYGNGTPGYIPLWNTFTSQTSSAMYQNLANGKIGVGTTTPNAKFDVNDNNNPGYFALSGTTSNSGEVGTYGNNLAPSGNGVGTAGHALSPTGIGVFGFHDSKTGAGIGVSGLTNSSSGVGVLGTANTPTGTALGVSGASASVDGVGVAGLVTSTGAQGHKSAGVRGTAQDPNGAGGFFANLAVTGPAVGVTGASLDSATGSGVYGVGGTPSNIGQKFGNLTTVGVWGDSGTGVGVFASADDATALIAVNNSGTGAAIGGSNQATTGSAAFGVLGTTASTVGAGVYGNATSTSGINYGVYGVTASTVSTNNNLPPSASGVYGLASANTGNPYGVFGRSLSPTGVGVYGWASSPTGNDSGIVGQTDSNTQYASGVFGVATPSSGQTYGVVGSTNSTSQNASGVFGNTTANTGAVNGVLGQTGSKNGTGVYGLATSADQSGFGIGVYGQSANGDAVHGLCTAVNCSGVAGFVSSNGTGGTNGIAGINMTSSGASSNGVYGQTNSSQGTAGYFNNTAGGTILLGVVNNSQKFYVQGSGNGYFAGSVQIDGNLDIKGMLSKGGGSFKIDDPIDPSNKYLSHSFVESPDMMNIYNGVIRLDARGEAWVVLPDYFDALNRDFRYQLTSVGSPQPRLYIAREVNGNRFKISGGRANGKVSWQVTGVRQDAWANAHRIPNEEDKPLEKRGTYLYPELYGNKSNQNTNAMLQH